MVILANWEIWSIKLILTEVKQEVVTEEVMKKKEQINYAPCL